MALNRGDHVRVLRLGYWHHGIYVADNRVIQFGGSIWHKRDAEIEAVSLEEFANSGSVRSVPHQLALAENSQWDAAAHADQTVDRAERMLLFHPEGKYNLFGRNCESIATFCATGRSDTPQVRGHLGVGVAILAVLAADYWGHERRSTWHEAFMTLLALTVGLGTAEHYIEAKRFQEELNNFFQIDDGDASSLD